MSKDYYQQELKGTRETALEAVQKIKADFERYGNSGHKDARKNQILFTYNILSGIIRSCQTLRKTAHYDIYVNIYTQVLAPKLDPTACPSSWRRLLPLLDYIFLTLAGYQFYAEAYQLYEYLNEIQLKWPDKDDFKYLLQIHGGQLQMLLKQTETNGADAIKKRIAEVFIALENLFDAMIKRCKETTIDSTALLSKFVSSIITTSSSTHLQLATTMQCVQMDNMNIKFFELLSINSKFVSSEDIAASFQVNFEALRQFLQLDQYSKLQQQLALQFVGILRNMKFTKENECIGYCCALLYKLIKLAYLQVRIGNFKEIYLQLSQKFCKYLKTSGETLMHEDWFQDFFVLVNCLLYNMQTSASDIFMVFWQHMDASLYIAHIQLITELFKITPLVTKFNLVKLICCKNPNWFHIQLHYTQIALESYTQLLKLAKHDSKVETKIEADFLLSLNAKISTILQNSIDTLISMEHECTRTAISIRKLCVTFAKLLQEANHSKHALNLIALAKDMTRLRSRISYEDWLMIMSRVNKIASICGDATIAADILSCYIAEMISKPTQPEFSLLHNFVQYYHHDTPGKCLLDIYLQSTSTFKSAALKKHERRIFHWLELQYITRFYDKEKDCAVFTTLAQRSETKYDFINVVYVGKLIDQSSVFTKVQNIYDILKNTKKSCKIQESVALARLEELTFAHTICLLLFKRFEDQRITMSSKDFQENNLEQLFQEKLLLSLSATKEMERIDMALEAFQAFEAFFNRADIEPLKSHDGYFLDWTHVLEDIVSLAIYFQETGYLDYALEAWLLHYRVANTIDDVQSSLRSLAFFCEYNIYFENDTRLDLSKEIDNKNENLMHILENLPQLLRRHQNFALTCVCQIAYYYATQKKLSEAHSLLFLVKHLHENKLQRQDYDIVLFTADIVNFRILWKHEKTTNLTLTDWKTSTPKECFQTDTYLLREIEQITARMRTYVQISNADMKPYILLFLSSIDELAEYASNRLCDIFLCGFLSSALRLCVERGMAVRSAQLLCKWVLINLQMEYLQKAEIKMQIIECILGVRDCKEIACSLKAAKSCPITVSKQLQNDHLYGTLPVGLEEVRKVAVLSTPALTKEKIYLPSKALDHKLENCYSPKEENGKQHRMSHVVLWNRFTLSCLRARFNFLSHHYKELQDFYENCEKWLEKRKHTFHFQAFQSIVLVCMMHCANYLRANKDYEKAIKHLKICIEHCAIQGRKVDDAYLINFELQLKQTKLEQLENRENRNLPTKKKVHTLGVFLKNNLELTPVGKTTKYTALPMTTTYKKPSSSMSTQKNAPFLIYSDRKSPRKALVNHTKKPTAIKDLKFIESSSSSGNESPAEIKTSKKINLNKFQTIEISGDSHFDVGIGDLKDTQETAITKTKTTSTKLKQQNKPKPKLKFLDSVDLEDTPPLKTNLTKEKTKVQRTESLEDEVIAKEMQNLAIIKTAATSKTFTAKAATLRRSPRLASQIDILEKPTTSNTHRKSPAINGLTFNENNSSSGNESSDECKLNTKINFNTCQLIELSDSDCDLQNSEEATKIKKSSTKLPQQKKPILKFLDSIDVEDSPVKKALTKKEKVLKNTKIQRKKSFEAETAKVKEPLASQIDLTAVPTTTASTSTLIDINDDSPLVSNTATTSRVTRKVSTKRTKTPKPTITLASSLSAPTVPANTLSTVTPENTTTRSNRLILRQPEIPNTLQTPINSYSLRRRQRN